MSPPIDGDLLKKVDTVGPTAWGGHVYRYTTARRDPLSGAGARLNGGRWNPKDIFAALYFATPVGACLGELERAAASQQLSVKTVLQVPYKFHTLDVQEVAVLDLRPTETMAAVSLTTADIESDDWGHCQQIGHAAWFLHFDGVLAPSATGRGDVLTLFEGRLAPGKLTLSTSEKLDMELFDRLKNA